MSAVTETGTGGSEEVADQVRRAIQEGEFVPNQRLVEADLSVQFAASRAAIRTALVQLAAEGLVERVQNRGARVRAVSLGEAIEISEVRMVVEGLCAAKAAERATDDDLDVLRGIGEDMQAAVDRGDVFGYSELNRRLHATVRPIGGQKVAGDVLERLRGQNVRHQFRLALLPGRASVSLPQHLEIIEAVRARDAARAEAAMRAHLASVIETLPAGRTVRRRRLTPRRAHPPGAPPAARVVWAPRSLTILATDRRLRGAGPGGAGATRRGGTMRTVVVTDPPRADVDDAATLGGHGVATVHEALGRVGYLGPEFRPAWSGARIGGTAVTVLCWPGDNLMIHVAVEQCRPGDVLVVATTSPSTDGLFGELFATALARRGVRGVVLASGVRDVAELREMGFPAWSRAISAQGSVKATAGAVNVPVLGRPDRPPRRRRGRRRRRRHGGAAR